MPEASLTAINAGSLFEQLLAGPVQSGERLLGELLTKPVASAVLTGVAMIPQLNPYLRAGVILSGVILSTSGQPLFLTGKSGGPTPANWATSHSPPVTQNGSIIDHYRKGKYYLTYGTFYPTPSAACAAITSNGGSYTPSGTVGSTYNINCVSGINSNWTQQVNYVVDNSVACPVTYTEDSGNCVKANCSSGYTYAGSGCSLNESPGNISPWPVNSTPVAMVPNSSNSGWEQAPRDSHVPSPALVPNFSTITQSSVSPSTGQPAQDSVTPTATGGISLKHSEQFTDAGGSTSVKTSTFTTDISGTITETTNVITPNITLKDFAASIPTVSNIDTSNLAKDSTLQSTNAKLDQLHADLTSGGGGGSFPAVPDECGIGECWTLVFNAIRAKFTVPSFSDSLVSCPVWSTVIHYPAVWTFTINQHCAWDSTIRPILQTVMAFAYAILGIKIVISA